MEAKKIVTELMEKQGQTNAQMAEKLHISGAAMWERLNPKKTNNLTVKKLNEMLVQLGYELVIMPRAKAGRIDDAYIVTDGRGEK